MLQEDIKKNFSENLINLRKANNLTQLQLAKILNTTQRRISYFETGKVEPDLDTLIAIAKYFEISIDYLVGLIEY